MNDALPQDLKKHFAIKLLGIKKMHYEKFPDEYHWCHEYEGKIYRQLESGKFEECNFAIERSVIIRGHGQIKNCIIKVK